MDEINVPEHKYLGRATNFATRKGKYKVSHMNSINILKSGVTRESRLTN